MICERMAAATIREGWAARSRCSEEEPGHSSCVEYSPHCGEEGGRIPVGTAIEVGRRWGWHHEEPEEVCR
jgi:hypothetical protein